ncbi:hypothetical protein ACOSQ3_016829 [Xanthoceras sorbifolium]
MGVGKGKATEASKKSNKVVPRTTRVVNFPKAFLRSAPSKHHHASVETSETRVPKEVQPIWAFLASFKNSSGSDSVRIEEK